MSTSNWSLSKVRSVLCVIGMIAALIAVLAIACALAVRLLELNNPGDQSSFPFDIFQFGPSDAAIEADHKMRRSLWILAIATLVLTGASAVFAVVVGRTTSRTLALLFVLCGSGACAISFLLAWPLGIMTAFIPASALPILFLSSAKSK